MKPMARLLCFGLIIAVGALMYALVEKGGYSAKHDDIDVRAILNNKDMRDAYYNCFMDGTKCQSEQQAYLTGIFSEAYITNCKKCTEKQKEIFEIVAEWYINNEPDKWKPVLEKIPEIMRANHG